MQDYKYLRVAVMICTTLVNTQSHTLTALTSYTISSAVQLSLKTVSVCEISHVGPIVEQMSFSTAWKSKGVSDWLMTVAVII